MAHLHFVHSGLAAAVNQHSHYASVCSCDGQRLTTCTQLQSARLDGPGRHSFSSATVLNTYNRALRAYNAETHD